MFFLSSSSGTVFWLHRRNGGWQCGDGRNKRRRRTLLRLQLELVCLYIYRRETILFESISASNSVVGMLSLHSCRTLFSSRALLHSNWLMTNRQSRHIAVKCSAHCVSFKYGSSPQRVTWHINTTLKTLGKEKKLMHSTNASLVNSSRSYCTGQVKLNCWNCKQPLDKTPAFFCMSCNVVQPPEEGTSYFKIMDWYVS